MKSTWTTLLDLDWFYAILDLDLKTFGLCYWTYKGRIQALFEIGNSFWVLKNCHVNFDKLTKDILIH